MNKPETQKIETEVTGEYTPLSHTFFDRFKRTDVECSYRFRRPTTQMASRAQKRMLKQPIPALKDLCLECVHVDDNKVLLDAGRDYPGLFGTFGGALLSSIGFGDLGNE